MDAPAASSTATDSPGAASGRGFGTWMAVAIGVLLLASVIVAMWLPAAPGRHSPAAAAATTRGGTGAPEVLRAVTLVGGQVQGEDTVRLRQGDQARITVASDRPLELHLHGYEIHATVGPGTAGVLAFEARLPGRFPVHEHREGAGNHRAVFFIEVLP